jgi:hypothetical protein
VAQLTGYSRVQLSRLYNDHEEFRKELARKIREIQARAQAIVLYGLDARLDGKRPAKPILS